MDKHVKEGKVQGQEKTKGNHNHDLAGSPNEETGQRTWGDFGINVRELNLSVMSKRMIF